jgi:hypothetical protein
MQALSWTMSQQLMGVQTWYAVRGAAAMIIMIRSWQLLFLFKSWYPSSSI